MKTIVPAYYKRFKCIASDCVHNCCLEGWEIDIDDGHVELYRELAAGQGDNTDVRILENLYLPTVKERRSGAVPHIKLSEEGICPFLNEKGLCMLILKYGEKAICNICTDHPRFRNFPKGHCELGIGLCCEEACRIILSDEETGEYEDVRTGKKEIPVHQSVSLKEKTRLLMKLPLDFETWAEYLLGLERLEEKWGVLLREFKKKNTGASAEQSLNRPLENLEEYFIYRYGCTGGTGFASFSLRMIRQMAGVLGFDMSDADSAEFQELCRLYSSEIEYSEENRNAVAAKLFREGYR